MSQTAGIICTLNTSIFLGSEPKKRPKKKRVTFWSAKSALKYAVLETREPKKKAKKIAIKFDHFFSLFSRFGWLKDTGRLRHFNSTGSPFSRAKSKTCLEPYIFIGKSLFETKKLARLWNLKIFRSKF